MVQKDNLQTNSTNSSTPEKVGIFHKENKTFRNIKLHLLISSLIVLISCGASNNNTNDMKTVKELDINKYLGTWYEIARYPHSFEKGLIGVTATYGMRKDGKISVINKGYKGSFTAEQSIAEGKAKIPDPSEPGKLKVSFFWIFYGDYFVLDLAPDYSYAMIGSSSPNYFWLLSRTPQMEENLYNSLIEKAISLGYSREKIEKVPQKPIN